MAALGYTLQLPTEDRFLLDEQELRAQIATLLGGDRQRKLSLARSQLEPRTIYNGHRFGRADGAQLRHEQSPYPLAFEQQQASFLTNNGMMLRAVSEETAQAIDREVKEIVESAHQQALSILKENRDLLEAIAQKLLEKEVIEGEELHELLSQVKTPTAA